MEFTDILIIQDVKERNRALKVAFAHYSSAICIDAHEVEAITCLLNLCTPKTEDYLDKTSASLFLNNHDNIQKCLDELKWFHSHNVKYPDCRVKGQSIISLPINSVGNIINSNVVPYRLGWSHDSGKVNYTHFLLSCFKWRGVQTTLSQLFITDTLFWLDIIKKIQCNWTKKQAEQFIHSIQKEMPTKTLPEDISPYSKQILFPYKNDYLTLTPVTSNSVQTWLEHQSRKPNDIRWIKRESKHPASVGALSSSIGGYHSLIFSPPSTSQSPHSYHDNMISKTEYKEAFCASAITEKSTTDALQRLISSEVRMNVKHRKQIRKSGIHFIRQKIALWLTPLIRWRDHIDNNQIQITNDHPSLVNLFLSSPIASFPDLLTPLHNHLNQTLGKNKYTKRFAYHPDLMPIFKSQLSWILNKLAQDENINQQPVLPRTQFIHLKNLRLYNGNALSSPYVCGLPSLTGFWGFMHDFERRLKTKIEENIHFEAFSLFVHQYELQSSPPLCEASDVYKKRELSPAKRLLTQPSYSCDMRFDLIIKVHTEVNLSDISQRMLSTMPARCVGGTLHQPSLHESLEWLRTYTSSEHLFEELACLPNSGRWIYPPSETFNTPDEFLSILGNSTHLAICNGYSFLEDPTNRENVSLNQHVFCEPLIGLAEQVIPIDMRLNRQKHYFSNAFWSINSDFNSILIQNHE